MMELQTCTTPRTAADCQDWQCRIKLHSLWSWDQRLRSQHLR